MHGFLSGLVLGAVVVAAGAAGVSLLTPLSRPDVATDAPAAATGTVIARRESGVDPAGADADLVEVAPAAPDAEASAPDDLASMAGADTQPTDRPQVGGATAGLNGPAEAPAAPELAAQGDAPVAPQAPGRVPDAPSAEASVPAVTDPTQPAAPRVTETGSGFGMDAPRDDAAPQVTSQSDPEMEPAQPTGPGTGPEGDSAPEAATDPGAAPQIAAAPEEADPEAPAPRMAALPQAGGEEDAAPRAPGIGTPVKPLTERDDPAPATPAGPPPIERFAARFENPGEQPLMSVLLIDDSDAIGVEALADFPYPLTFAIDPSAPDAAEKAARHRAAGFEVVLLADLPAAATAQDAEVALAVWRERVPEAVAILEGTGTGIQGNRALSDHVTEIAKTSGLGLVTQANGLNTVEKLAARAGVPSAVVFRDFDGAGQTPVVMRRFLDQAAFRAGQEGAVIMLGRVRPDTISALLLWGLQDRAQRVALAPVSAVLLGESGAE